MAVAELEPSPTFVDIDSIAVPKGYEVVDGELVEMPDVSNLAIWVANELNGKLKDWNKTARAGVVLPPESEFACFPDKPRDMRKPDGAFVISRTEPFFPTHAKFKFPPDLVIEVLSPTNTMSEMFDRFTDYFSAGAKLIWLIEPEQRFAQVYLPDFSSTKVAENESLVGGDLLPGFRLPLAEILPPKA
jgi:Uma2 family endonuclease